jgi:type IV secretory pathway TrbD component
MKRRSNPVFRALNAPLTLLGVERKLFFLALVIGAAVFNLLHTLLGGMLMFGLLYWFARWATKTDPQILRLLLNSSKTRVQYDPMKFSLLKFHVMRSVPDDVSTSEFPPASVKGARHV